MKTKLSGLYETDFNLWIEQTINHLKQGNLGALDLDNLIEEISDMGRNNRREVFSRLKVLLMHLLKWKYQPEKRTNSSTNTIDEQREQLELIFNDSPSLKPYLADIFSECYQKAVRSAVNETNLPKQACPVDCPFTQEQVLDQDYLP
jgi:hypothetical protein